MRNSSVLDKVMSPGIITINSPDGRFQHELTNLWSPDTEIAKSCVLDLVSPLYNPINTAKIYDRSGKGNHGAITGAVWTQLPSGEWVLWFDKIDDYILVPTSTSIDSIFDAGGTYDTWINPGSDGEGDSGYIFGKRVAGGWMLSCTGETAGRIKIYFYHNFTTTNGHWQTTATEVAINTWSKITVTYNSSATTNDPIISVNGVSVALTEVSTPIGTRVSDATVNLFVGNNSAASTCTFDGYIGKVTVYKGKTLTAAEILHNYQATKWRFS